MSLEYLYKDKDGNRKWEGDLFNLLVAPETKSQLKAAVAGGEGQNVRLQSTVLSLHCGRHMSRVERADEQSAGATPRQRVPPAPAGGRKAKATSEESAVYSRSVMKIPRPEMLRPSFPWRPQPFFLSADAGRATTSRENLPDHYHTSELSIVLA
jgi:hypothetical protein